MTLRTLAPWLRRTSPATQGGDTIYSLQREMNTLFNDFFKGLEFEPFSMGEQVAGDYVPHLDMHESEKEIVVSAELPGLEEKDINVSIAKDVLTIAGEKKNERSEDTKGHYKMERMYGLFRRSIRLPFEVDSASCQATFKNGVLTVTLPKTAESQKTVKPIQIKKG